MIAATVCVAIAACGCRRAPADVPVPRRTAYYRLQLPDTLYRPIEVDRVLLEANADATTQCADTGWITISYPTLNASIYVTVTPLTPATAAEAVDNRVERLSLNTGGQPSQVMSFTTPAGMDARVIVTDGSVPTPVQFIVTDYRRVLVSGSAVVDDAATAPVDSLAPVLQVLERDIVRLAAKMKTL